MRGSPPLQLALLLLSFIALAIPLVQLTSARETVTAPVATIAVEGKALPVTLRLRFAHQPTKLTLELNGKPLLAGRRCDAVTHRSHHRSQHCQGWH